MKKKFSLTAALMLLLAGCGEHEFCEKQRSALARMKVGLVEFSQTKNMADLSKANAAAIEANEVGKEIDMRKIKCNDKD